MNAMRMYHELHEWIEIKHTLAISLRVPLEDIAALPASRAPVFEPRATGVLPVGLQRGGRLSSASDPSIAEDT